MNWVIAAISIPFAVGVLVFICPKRLRFIYQALSLLASGAAFAVTIVLFTMKPLTLAWQGRELFYLDNLSAFILLAIGFFGFILFIYSFSFMKGVEGANRYYAYYLWTLGASIGAALANHLILFLGFWGFLAATLYLLIQFGKDPAKDAAKKSLIIIGGSDCILILGIAIVWHISKSFTISEISIAATTPVAIVAFLCFAIAAFAKAGAMPFHSWIPDCAHDAPAPVTAYIPASLDKLLGIYFLARISLDIFKMGKGLGLFLMAIGSFTIVAAVMMALVQHDMKKLLGYHAVSQVGYMVLGIGTGTPIGIAGGLFHMLNNAIYKSCLFLTAGAVEKKTGTTDLEKLGGLINAMPFTFAAAAIASLSISGVPPFNGFVSKWMVYQGVIELSSRGGWLWIVWLVAAMIGSALTLASFIKVLHTVFLGQVSEARSKELSKIHDVGFGMKLPMGTLAILCVVFGVFAAQIPLRYLINPSVVGEVAPLGVWNSTLATGLILVGIVLGLIIYWLGRTKTNVREDSTYIGGESAEDMRISGVDFYETIHDLGPLRATYAQAEKGNFDIYEIGRKIVFSISRGFQHLHSGVLLTYVTWCILGLVILLWIFLAGDIGRV